MGTAPLVPLLHPHPIPVFDEEVTLHGPTGKYKLAVTMERGGSPMGGRATFYMSEAPAPASSAQALVLWGIDERVERWLRSSGFTCRLFERAEASEREIILVGESFAGR